MTRAWNRATQSHTFLDFKMKKYFFKSNITYTHIYTLAHTQAKIDKERNANALNTTIIDFAFIFNVRYVYVWSALSMPHQKIRK